MIQETVAAATATQTPQEIPPVAPLPPEQPFSRPAARALPWLLIVSLPVVTLIAGLGVSTYDQVTLGQNAVTQAREVFTVAAQGVVKATSLSLAQVQPMHEAIAQHLHAHPHEDPLTLGRWLQAMTTGRPGIGMISVASPAGDHVGA